VIADSACQAAFAVSGLGFRVSGKLETLSIAIRHMASDMPAASEKERERKSPE
jgi:L-cysteine desulfidase